MGEDNRSETMPNLAKRESSWGFELTRSNSEVSSLTSEYFKDVLHQSVNDNHTTWTNEQHNNYLNYLEMSFVKQLQSMGSLAWTSCQSDGRPSQKQFADFNRSSEQFTVPQDSEFPKLNIGKSCAADMAGSRKSPRTHCLRQASKVSTAYSDIQECHEFHGKEKQLKGKKTCSCGSASYSERNYLCYSSCQNSVGSIREGTGQNFVDEDQEQNPSIVSRSKGQKLL